MKKGKFIRLLKTLTIQEIKAFDHYLYGLYGTKKQMLQVYAYIQKYRTNYDANRLDKAIALEKYFIPNGISPKILTNRLSNLFKCLEEFLVWKKITAKKNQFQYEKLKLEIWKERKLADYFFRDVEKLKKQIEAQPIDIWYSFKLMYLTHLEYFSSNTDPSDTSFDTNLDHLEHFFIAARLKYYLIEINRKNVYNKIPRKSLFLDIIPKEKLAALKDNPFIDVYLNLIDLLRDKKEAAYFYLKKQLKYYTLHLGNEDLVILFTAMFNFASIQLRAGQERYIEEKFSLYQFGLDSEILLVDNFLDGNQFTNIINLACALEKVQLAKSIQDTWLSKTPPKQREALRQITDAIIYFYLGNYEAVLENLRATKFHNAFYAIRAKSLIMLSLLMTQENSQLVLDYCKAFNIWLKREKTVSKALNLGAKNALQLVKLYYQKREEKEFDWETEINKTNPLFHSNWFKKVFLEKIKFGLIH